MQRFGVSIVGVARGSFREGFLGISEIMSEGLVMGPDTNSAQEPR